MAADCEHCRRSLGRELRIPPAECASNCGPCFVSGSPCPDFLPEKESRYERLFGTPERAAKTIFEITECCQEYTVRSCHRCLLADVDCSDPGDIKKWLGGDVE